MGAMPPARANLASLAKRWAPAISPISLPAVSGPNRARLTVAARPGRRARRSRPRAHRWCGSARAGGVARRGRIRTLAVCSARARRRPILVVFFFDNRAQRGRDCSGQRSCRCQSNRCRARCACEPDVRGDRPAAGCRARRRPARHRQPVDAFAQRGAGDRDRVDAVGLSAVATTAALAGHQPRRDPDHAFAMDKQKPLEGT